MDPLTPRGRRVGPSTLSFLMARQLVKRGVGAGRSAQRGTSGAATGPRGARSAPPNPHRPLLNQALGHEISLSHILSIFVVIPNVIVHRRQVGGGELGGDAVQQRLGVW